MKAELQPTCNPERPSYSNHIYTLKDIKPDGKKALLRSDLDFKGSEHETSGRFFAVKPTVNYLEERGAEKITLLAHNGDKTSLRYLIRPLEDLLQEEVAFVTSSDGTTEGRKIVLFENTRLNAGEESNDPKFVAELAQLGNVYINNAFATSHRAHASTEGLPRQFIQKANEIACGLQIEREIEEIDKALSRPKNKFIAVIGGAKIKTKLPVIKELAQIAETVLVGGALPLEIEKEGIKLPNNVIVAIQDKEKNFRDIDIRSAQKFALYLSEAETIVWNGAMGVFEDRKTARGTLIVARGMLNAKKNNNNCYLLAGGGETEEFLKSNNMTESFDWISTGGGAMLEYVGGKKLQALEALRK